MNWQAILLSLQLAGVTVVILLILGVPLAYWLSYTSWRGKAWLEAVIALPLVLPPTVLGFYILVSIGPRSPFGRTYAELFDSTLPFSFEGLVVGSVIYSMPFAVQPLISSFSSVDRALLEASWTLGISRFETFWRVILPQSVQGLLTAVVLAFAHTVGEFGVVLMVGGNIEGETRTVSIAIYDDVQMLNYDAASRTSLLLLVFSFLVLVVVYSLNQKSWRIWSINRN